VNARRNERYLRTRLRDKIFRNFSTFFLHLWKIPVISNVRTNFAAIPGNRNALGSLEMNSFGEPGRRGGESESLQEEHIEIGNS
jgi:hypothetical protein